MHQCPKCGQYCFCDHDDTDFGFAPLGGECSKGHDDFCDALEHLNDLDDEDDEDD
jgi:hypothetical protein